MKDMLSIYDQEEEKEGGLQIQKVRDMLTSILKYGGINDLSPRDKTVLRREINILMDKIENYVQK